MNPDDIIQIGPLALALDRLVAVALLLAFLTADCCSGNPDICGGVAELAPSCTAPTCATGGNSFPRSRRCG